MSPSSSVTVRAADLATDPEGSALRLTSCETALVAIVRHVLVDESEPEVCTIEVLANASPGEWEYVTFVVRDPAGNERSIDVVLQITPAGTTTTTTHHHHDHHDHHDHHHHPPPTTTPPTTPTTHHPPPTTHHPPPTTHHPPPTTHHHTTHHPRRHHPPPQPRLRPVRRPRMPTGNPRRPRRCRRQPQSPWRHPPAPSNSPRRPAGSSRWSRSTRPPCPRHRRWSTSHSACFGSGSPTFPQEHRCSSRSTARST